VNPHGGQLACGDLDGVGLLAEAVRRVRASGTRTRPVLVAGSPLEATSAVLLSA